MPSATDTESSFFGEVCCHHDIQLSVRRRCLRAEFKSATFVFLIHNAAKYARSKPMHTSVIQPDLHPHRLILQQPVECNHCITQLSKLLSGLRSSSILRCTFHGTTAASNPIPALTRNRLFPTKYQLSHIQFLNLFRVQDQLQCLFASFGIPMPLAKSLLDPVGIYPSVTLDGF